MHPHHKKIRPLQAWALGHCTPNQCLGLALGFDNQGWRQLESIKYLMKLPAAYMLTLGFIIAFKGSEG